MSPDKHDEALSPTANVPPPGPAAPAPMPEPLQQEIVDIHAGPEADRTRRVDALCHEHPEHADEIRAILAVLDGTEKQIEFAAQQSSWIPQQIGPYKILSVLGEGGMGTVYLAEQKEPVRRRVALKLIKLGMDSAMVLRRFEAERQALAMMEHDNIARVYQAGTTDRGQPYFVMEYVKGLPITKYCDKHKLDLEQRLDLFNQVCAGVQHAHQKGVIHRDLTPKNILVTLQDGEPTPKIIDFGIARATDHRLTEATLFTEQGLIIGTPEYMSPEQAGLDALDIDTRTDIYTLGVLLYHLLVGELPFSPKELREAGLGEMERKIREDDPPRPSTRLTASKEHTNKIAELRRTDVSKLTLRLKGDLDWIVMKALEKNRTRRYQTAVELSQDIERHLADEPVLASPPSLRYRATKFMRRYRGPVIAASTVFALLLIGMAGTTSNMLEARTNRETADVLASAARLLQAQEEVRELYQNPPWPEHAEAMESWIALAEPLEDIPVRLTRQLAQIRSTGISDGNDPDAQSRHDRLVTLRDDLEEFLREDPLPGDLFRIRERRDWAMRIESLTRDHPDVNPEYTWDKAREAILKAEDDELASYLYADVFEPIDLRPQMGLVPLGPNSEKLWEFYHLASAADPNVLPERNADGDFDITEETGIIFVLLPGGHITTYAQPDDRDQINYRPNVELGSPIPVTLSPFLLSKYEMTQAQWERLSFGDTPSYYPVGYVEPSTGNEVTGANPVEYVTWIQSRALLLQYGLRFPTGVEWEYACRAGTRGSLPLEGYANVLDQTGGKADLPVQIGFVDIDDGFAIHAPVGSFNPNDWKFFDMLGNVLEYCEDLYSPPYRMSRGGAFVYGENAARPGFRNDWPADGGNNHFGVRPARSLDR